MKCTKANFTKVMKIEDLSVRKVKLESMALQICWHGDVWYEAMCEIDRLNKLGVKTPLQKKFESH